METEKNDIIIRKGSSNDYLQPSGEAFYRIMLFKGKGTFYVDFTEFDFAGNTVLFLAPYQNFQWKSKETVSIDCLDFHGDFYCIEYHKKEVACNGLLFNNVYLFPHFAIDLDCYNEILALFTKIEKEKSSDNAFSAAVLKAYLQLILALGSKEKSVLLAETAPDLAAMNDIAAFQNLLEQNFLEEKSPSFYAAALSLSPDAFAKKIKKQFGKTPTRLIQDRIILEAKKLLHLTRKSVKEIACDLKFDDEFYFSRYFKKGVGLSPLRYREKVGISIVAK